MGPETGTADDAITRVTVGAFRTLEISTKTEQFIIRALRTAGALAVSVVAEMEDEVVGHVAFSPVTVSDEMPGRYGLGSVAVLPEAQRQGTGTSMVWKDCPN
jgi:putative acetyltransferase